MYRLLVIYIKRLIFFKVFRPFVHLHVTSLLHACFGNEACIKLTRTVYTGFTGGVTCIFLLTFRCSMGMLFGTFRAQSLHNQWCHLSVPQGLEYNSTSVESFSRNRSSVWDFLCYLFLLHLLRLTSRKFDSWRPYLREKMHTRTSSLSYSPPKGSTARHFRCRYMGCFHCSRRSICCNTCNYPNKPTHPLFQVRNGEII